MTVPPALKQVAAVLLDFFGLGTTIAATIVLVAWVNMQAPTAWHVARGTIGFFPMAVMFGFVFGAPSAFGTGLVAFAIQDSVRLPLMRLAIVTLSGLLLSLPVAGDLLRLFFPEAASTLLGAAVVASIVSHLLAEAWLRRLR